MSERISEAALAMDSPRGFVIRGGFYRRRGGLASLIDEAVWIINEDLDPRGGEADIRRAQLCLPAWYSLVNEEWRAVYMETGNSAEVPELGRAECRRVPTNCRSSVGDDQHHRQKRAASFAIRSSHQTTHYRRSCNCQMRVCYSGAPRACNGRQGALRANVTGCLLSAASGRLTAGDSALVTGLGLCREARHLRLLRPRDGRPGLGAVPGREPQEPPLGAM